jgi:hypothetical protein
LIDAAAMPLLLILYFDTDADISFVDATFSRQLIAISGHYFR